MQISRLFTRWDILDWNEQMGRNILKYYEISWIGILVEWTDGQLEDENILKLDALLLLAVNDFFFFHWHWQIDCIFQSCIFPNYIFQNFLFPNSILPNWNFEHWYNPPSYESLHAHIDCSSLSYSPYHLLSNMLNIPRFMKAIFFW